MTEIKLKISRILEAEAAAIAAIKVTDVFEDAVNTLMQSSGKIVSTEHWQGWIWSLKNLLPSYVRQVRPWKR